MDLSREEHHYSIDSIEQEFWGGNAQEVDQRDKDIHFMCNNYFSTSYAP